MQLRRSFTADGRAWVQEAWQAAEGVFTRLSRLSPLTTPLGTRLAERYAAAEGLEAEEVGQAFVTVMMAGYASRTVLAGPTDQPVLDRALLSVDTPGDAGQIALDTAAVGDLIGAVESVAAADFHSVMVLPPDVWAGYVALATLALQRDLASSTLTWRELSRDRIEAMLRYGYVLRCLDEAFHGEPTLDRPLPT
jgi:hypothetical protein